MSTKAPIFSMNSRAVARKHASGSRVSSSQPSRLVSSEVGAFLIGFQVRKG